MLLGIIPLLLVMTTVPSYGNIQHNETLPVTVSSHWYKFEGDIPNERFVLFTESWLDSGIVPYHMLDGVTIPEGYRIVLNVCEGTYLAKWFGFSTAFADPITQTILICANFIDDMLYYYDHVSTDADLYMFYDFNIIHEISHVLEYEHVVMPTPLVMKHEEITADLFAVYLTYRYIETYDITPEQLDMVLNGLILVEIQRFWNIINYDSDSEPTLEFTVRPIVTVCAIESILEQYDTTWPTLLDSYDAQLNTARQNMLDVCHKYQPLINNTFTSYDGILPLSSQYISWEPILTITP